MYSRFIEDKKLHICNETILKNVGEQFYVIFSTNQLVQSAERNFLIAHSRTISQFDDCQKTEERDISLKINL